MEFRADLEDGVVAASSVALQTERSRRIGEALPQGQHISRVQVSDLAAIGGGLLCTPFASITFADVVSLTLGVESVDATMWRLCTGCELSRLL